MIFQKLAISLAAGGLMLAPLAASANAVTASPAAVQAQAGDPGGDGAAGKGRKGKGGHGIENNNWLLPAAGAVAVIGIVAAVAAGGGHKAPVSP